MENTFKTKAFLCVTAVISIVCFNFNKVLYTVLSFICTTFNDNSSPVHGPYMNIKPIIIDLAMIDDNVCTNKLNLLVNWYWDCDIDGILTSNLLLPGRHIIIQYRKKYNNSNKTYRLYIDRDRNTITRGRTINNILFEEIKLI